MKLSDIIVGTIVVSGLYLVWQMNGSRTSSAELDRVYALAMNSTMQSVPELQWASALLRSHGRVGQADAIDTKITAIKAAPAASSVPTAGFQTGHHYTGRVQLSRLEALFAGSSDVKSAADKAIGMPVAVQSLGSGAYLISGVWTGAPMPYPVPLPDRVVWIRDDTTGEQIT